MVGDIAVEGPYLPPLGTEQEFTELVGQLVADAAPRLFALVEEHGDRADGWIVAWGIALDDRVVVCGTAGELVGTFGSAERAHALLSRRRKLRLQWAPHSHAHAENAVAAVPDVIR